jgi:formylglycine-generating enzyme required for sulfatase activity
MQRQFLNIFLFAFSAQFLFSCGLSLEQGTVDYWSENVEKTHITTDPPGASLIITSVESGKGATISTSTSPNDIYYTARSGFGTHLTVFKDGYEKTTVKLGRNQKDLHIILRKKKTGEIEKEPISGGSSVPFKSGRPDFTHIPGISTELTKQLRQDIQSKPFPAHPGSSQQDVSESVSKEKKNLSITQTGPPSKLEPAKVPTQERLPQKSSVTIQEKGAKQRKEKTVSKTTKEIVAVKRKITRPKKKTAGSVIIESYPNGAVLYVDNKRRGLTTKKLNLKPGKHRLRLVLSGYQEQSRDFIIAKNQTSRFKIDLQSIRQIPGMIYIPAGKFIMGNNQGQPDEKPEHHVFLKGYFIDAMEVTNREYQEFLKVTGRFPPDFMSDPDLNGPNQPVVGISWEDATAYAKWVGKRLPTEAEWEKAARGTKSWKYPFGNQFKEKHANKSGKSDGYAYTAPVDKFRQGKSPYGLFQMAGNVREWCANWYQADYYTVSSKDKDQEPKIGAYKVIRGGSWDDNKQDLLATTRRYNYTNYLDYKTGFRCAKSE